MLLVRTTSKGDIGLDFHGGSPRFGFNVSIGVFDDAGWMEEAARWSPFDRDGRKVPETEFQSSLAKAIVAGASLPESEAEELSGVALKEWRERGGERAGRGDTIKGFGLVTAIGGTILLVLVAIVVAALFLTGAI